MSEESIEEKMVKYLDLASYSADNDWSHVVDNISGTAVRKMEETSIGLEVCMNLPMGKLFHAVAYAGFVAGASAALAGAVIGPDGSSVAQKAVE